MKGVQWLIGGGRGGGGEAEREEWAPIATIAGAEVGVSCAWRALQPKERVALARTCTLALALLQCTPTRLLSGRYTPRAGSRFTAASAAAACVALHCSNLQQHARTQRQ